jgi:hypothetical protein
MVLPSLFEFALTALVRPWSFDRCRAGISSRAAVVVALGFILAAAAISTLLSRWTYLVGKGLILGLGEMDMGRDDLPADTVGQVVFALVGSLVIWIAMLTIAVLICLAVADALYRGDRWAWRVAAQRTSVLTVWFVVWAAVVLAANSIRQDEVRHPASAIRAYAQLSQSWFRGSSAVNPGPIEREPLVARGRLRILAIAFPIIWSLALPRASRSRRVNRPLIIGLAISLSWIAWAGIWRLLPWSAIDAFAG